MHARAISGAGLAGLCIVLAAVPLRKAAAQDQAAFFKGKTIRIAVGFPPGGSYDFYARLAGDMLKAHIPGLEAAIVATPPDIVKRASAAFGG